MLNLKKMEYRVLTPDNKDMILQQQRIWLEQEFPQLHSAEKEMMQWKAPWREESLEHYLKSRWCMGIFSDDLKEIKAYFLAQPFLYFEGYTQNLWIEHLFYKNHEVGVQLVDLAVRYGKDKHLQRVIFKEDPILKNTGLPYSFIYKTDRVEIFTTKLGI